MAKNHNETVKYGNPLYVVKESTATLHITKGNSKLGKGIYNFSTLPGNQENLLILNHAVLLTDVAGTCSKHCEGCFNGGCYAVNSAKLHHNVVIKAWAENTLLLRAGKVFTLIDEYISKKNATYKKTKNVSDAKVRNFRINVSGEIENAWELTEWNKIAAAHPEVTFGLYTKNYEALEEFLRSHDDTEPNFVINISQWHGVADDFLAKYPGKFNVFEYDNSNRSNHDFSPEDVERLSHVIHCPAVLKTGKHAKNAAGENITCDHCGRCYRKTGQVTAVWDH